MIRKSFLTNFFFFYLGVTIMAIPVLLWGAAAALAATGIVKGAQAIGDINDAKDIGERAEKRYQQAKSELEEAKTITNLRFEELGKLKVDIFQNQIQHILNVIKRSNNTNATSKLAGFESVFSIEEIKEMEQMAELSFELSTNFASSAATGALAGFGVYGSIPFLATASTGAAISSLSGAAATNATLAWLGGGSLAAGGFGMAGGMVALGGIVAGPALAVGGFLLASKAEEALTQAEKYKAQVSEAIAQFELIEEGLSGLRRNADEIEYTLTELVQRFEQSKVQNADELGFHEMCLIGKTLKKVMNTPIMHKDGSPIANIKEVCSGYLEISASA